MAVVTLSSLFRQLIKYRISPRILSKQGWQLREDHPIMNDLFFGAADVTEEAILNSLSQAVTTTGWMGNTVHAYPFE